jgi:hypothetical protein
MPKIWEPTPRQAEFLQLPDSIFEALYGGSAGGGKTDTLLYLPLARKFHEHPKYKGIILRRTFPELESEVILRSRDFYSQAGGTYKDAKRRWEFPSGAIQQFGHCEHEKDVTKYDSSEYNYVAWDESTSFTEFQYLYLSMSRCRSSSADLPAIVRGGTNPGGVSHNFFRQRFVAPARQGGVILRERRLINGVESEIKRIFIPSSLRDNKYLLAADPNYINRLAQLPEAERRAKLDGDWWIFSGQVFDEWRIQSLSDEPSNARHVIEPFQIPSYWPRLLAIDWGYSAMTCAGWYTINPCPTKERPAKFIKYREYTAKKTKISTWATDLRRLSASEDLIDVVLDPSAWSSRGDELTVAEQFAQYFGRAARKATNDRIGGKLLLQELLRWKPRPARYVPPEGFDEEVYIQILRLRGEQVAEEYKALFQPEPPEPFLPQFQVFNTCEKTIETIPVCVYDKDHKEDVAEFSGDDPYDETRYGTQACHHYTEVGQAEHARAAAVEGVCSRREHGGSLTQFYIDMANLEARDSRASKAVQIFHRNRRLKHANFG